MMRAVREQPRVVALRVFLVACLVGFGFVLGAGTGGGSGDVARVDPQRAAVHLSLVGARADLAAADTEVRTARNALLRSQARVRGLERANRRTTRALRDARGDARRARRNR